MLEYHLKNLAPRLDQHTAHLIEMNDKNRARQCSISFLFLRQIALCA